MWVHAPTCVVCLCVCACRFRCAHMYMLTCIKAFRAQLDIKYATNKICHLSTCCIVYTLFTPSPMHAIVSRDNK